MKPKIPHPFRNISISFIFVVACFLGILFVHVLSADNFALLSGNLRTFQAHACDGDELRLNCTLNTVISINFVQYGRLGPTDRLCRQEDNFYFRRANASSPCVSNNAVKVIEEKCRGQVLCRMIASPDTFHEDPCPNEKKYAEVAYKCRPGNFSNKIACEGQRLRLTCPSGQRLVIFSATFGTTNPGILACPQQEGISGEDCEASYATETVMSICSRQQKCSILADTETFGHIGCSPDRVKYLKVTYVCVAEEVLKRPPDEESDGSVRVHSTSYPAWAGGLDHSPMPNHHRPREVMSKATTVPQHTFKLEMQSDEVPTDENGAGLTGNQRLVGFFSEWISAHKYVAGNKDKLILYVVVSVGVGLLIFLTVLGVRLILLRTSSRRSSKMELSPPTEDQFFSDSDLEQYETDNSPSEAPVTITSYTSTLRRHDSDAQPRTPVTPGAEHNHYFS